MDQNGAVFPARVFDESDGCVDDALVNDVLESVFVPIEGEEAHALDDCVVLAVSACAVYYVRHLVQRQPLDVLSTPLPTCAITSSPRNRQSVIFVGIDTSSSPTHMLLARLISFNFQLLYYKSKLKHTQKPSSTYTHTTTARSH